MRATITIYKNENSDPIVLEKEHADLDILRRWQLGIANKKNDGAMIIGSIDNFESFIYGKKE